jgi:cobalamin synthase
LIRSRWRQWLLPGLCLLPYVGSILWLLQGGQIWIAQLMLAPLVMAAVLAIVTLELARREFGGRWRR